MIISPSHPKLTLCELRTNSLSSWSLQSTGNYFKKQGRSFQNSRDFPLVRPILISSVSTKPSVLHLAGNGPFLQVLSGFFMDCRDLLSQPRGRQGSRPSDTARTSSAQALALKRQIKMSIKCLSRRGNYAKI